jgi:hypothetical protein
VNASVQQAVVSIVEALDLKGLTVYRAELPEGAKLVKAAGTSGFRGFSRTGGETTHAVFTPIMTERSMFLAAGTVLAVGVVALQQRIVRQRRIDAILGRQEERHYIERVAAQWSVNEQLSLERVP